MSETIYIDGGYPVDKIANVLANDGIVIMPSDTVYGFLFTQNVAEKVRMIKRRDDKPFLFFISDINQLEELKVRYKPFIDVLKKNWPGPFTFIFDNHDGTTSGVRMPEWDVLKELSVKTGKVLYSTSVNFSGQPPMEDVADMHAAFDGQVDLFVFDKSFLPGTPSTIVRLSENDGVKIIRKGGSELRL